METDADADDPFSEPMPEVEMPKIVEIVDPFFDYEENSDPTIITGKIFLHSYFENCFQFDITCITTINLKHCYLFWSN